MAARLHLYNNLVIGCLKSKMQGVVVELWLSHGCHIFMSHCRSFSMLMSVASSLLLPSCLGHYSVFSESSESFCVFWVSYALCASIYAISTLSPPSIFSTCCWQQWFLAHLPFCWRDWQVSGNWLVVEYYVIRVQVSFMALEFVDYRRFVQLLTVET